MSRKVSKDILKKKNEWVTDYIMQEGQGTFELESIYCILEIGDTL